MHLDLITGLEWYLVFLFSTCCHEAAHAWSALRLGDDTAYRGGQVTLAPMPHIRREPIGMVVVPLLSWVLGGWMMGWASAPYDPDWAMRHPRRAGVMAAAGPASNLILVLIAALLMNVGVRFGYFEVPEWCNFRHVVVGTGTGNSLSVLFAQMLSLFFSLNLLLGLFNLLPFPPLDGSSVPLMFMSPRAGEQYWLAMRQPTFSMMGLLLAWKIAGPVFPAIWKTALDFFFMTIPG